ncbi:hypothetical protein [Sinosporangium album]|uniref:hypothetical protein n=1 Tax=Sinosporangium album TaxID=504805 RepID=UPI00115FDDA0|nr:hypothetical protein [Sinosporangium album]
MLDGVGENKEAREASEVPTYVTAEAETTPIPKITDEPQPPPPAPARRKPLSRVGDLPMRVIYRIVGVVALAAAVVIAAVVVFTLRDRPAGRHVAAPSTAPPGTASPAGTSPVGVPGVVPPGTASPAVTPTPTPTPTPERRALRAALADKRVPNLPKRTVKLKKLSGKPLRVKKRITDRRSGVVLPRFGKPWKVAKAKPYGSRQVQPKLRGAMLVSLPMPVAVQAKPRDTALLAARWSLKHHPKGGKISWVASQPYKKKGWLLAYRVKYKVKGKKRTAMAAVLVVRTAKAKPALVFATIPESKSKRWRDVNTVVSALRAVR